MRRKKECDYQKERVKLTLNACLCGKFKGRRNKFQENLYIIIFIYEVIRSEFNTTTFIFVIPKYCILVFYFDELLNLKSRSKEGDIKLH